jgi:formate C-acetyltransferase
MKIESIYSAEELTSLAKMRFQEERTLDCLEGWFLAKEIAMECAKKYQGEADSIRIGKTLVEIMSKIPLTLGDYHIFAGTEDDAFARSYALINPSFSVKSFSGYCDPVAVFQDIEPSECISKERIQHVKEYYSKDAFAKALSQAYQPVECYTEEVVFFLEQVTGHVIPDVRGYLHKGAVSIQKELLAKMQNAKDEKQAQYFEAMKYSIDALLILANRYRELALEKASSSQGKKREQFQLMADTLEKVPAHGATNLYEAIQSFLLIWQLMCVEQTPNPFAFSVGNADRIFEEFRTREKTDRVMSSALLKHLLVFFNVADRSWAISQNLIIGGRDVDGSDLTNETSFALMDAYYDMNLPQPILSVKLHRNTPDEMYREMGRFFFTPGVLTPSLFNDDAIFPLLRKHGIEEVDLPDYSVAGCQEPLIMGKDNGNTTNSWLNLPKVLELVLHGGRSAISGKQIGKTYEQLGCVSAKEVLERIRPLFYQELEWYVDAMVKHANQASEALSLYQVPFLSTMMGGIDSGIDMRDAKEQGTCYNGSGCLIHGSSVIADSFVAIDTLLEERPEDANRLLRALETDFEEDEEMLQFLLSCEKFGNNIKRVDEETADVISRVSKLVSSKKNYLGNPFRPDFATPSTHLMYGYWVGATPDGRRARQMLNYGVDPLFGDASLGMGMRMLSHHKLPFECMPGGCASHLGIDPHYFKGSTCEEKGMEFRTKVFTPLFFPEEKENQVTPFYVYVNVTTPEILRKVLDNPKKYAPSGVYIVRIHGTFVNFLDLSPEIQEDIICRLDPKSTAF